MTREKFEEIRADVLGEIKNAAERERIRAVTYAQGMQNQRDGLPLFGWNPKIPAWLWREVDPLKPALKWGRGGYLPHDPGRCPLDFHDRHRLHIALADSGRVGRPKRSLRTRRHHQQIVNC